MAQMHGAGRVGAHKFYLYFPAPADILCEECLSRSKERLQLFIEERAREGEIYKTRARYLYFLEYTAHADCFYHILRNQSGRLFQKLCQTHCKGSGQVTQSFVFWRNYLNGIQRCIVGVRPPKCHRNRGIKNIGDCFFQKPSQNLFHKPLSLSVEFTCCQHVVVGQKEGRRSEHLFFRRAETSLAGKSQFSHCGDSRICSQWGLGVTRPLRLDPCITSKKQVLTSPGVYFYKIKLLD